MRLVLSLMGIAVVASLPQRSIRVLKSDLTLEDEGMSGARLIDERVWTFGNDFSACIRFYLKSLQTGSNRSSSSPVLHMERSGDGLETNFLSLSPQHPFTFVAFGHPRERDSYTSWLIGESRSSESSAEIWQINRWNHFCISYRSQDAFVAIVKDGHVTNVNFTDDKLRKVKIPSDLLQIIHLGRCSVSKQCSAQGAKFSDLNVWNRALSQQEMEQFTNCQDTSLKGNVVNWERTKFELVNMSEGVEREERICQPPRPGTIMMPEMRNFTAHVAICHKAINVNLQLQMRGEVSIVDSQSKQDAIMQIGAERERLNVGLCRGHTWTGYWDEHDEGFFTNVHNREERLGSFAPWDVEEPNGGTHENCAALMPNGFWIDSTCEKPKCGFCHLDVQPTLRIRGLCPNSRFDNKFSWTGETIDGRYAFFGMTSTLLSYRSDTKQWTLKNRSNNETVATTRMEEYPFGTSNWVVFNDPCYRDTNDQVMSEMRVQLNLNNCESNEFNCRDGSCIAMESRCDGRAHCPDLSDELNCLFLSTDASYLKFMPPAGEGARSLFPVNVSVDVLNVLGISEVENFVHLQLQLHLTWKDDRLRMYNLKEDHDMNCVTYKVRRGIWLPEIVFFNTEGKPSSVDDDQVSAIVFRNGTYTLEPKSQLHNGHIYQGGENPIRLSRVYSYKYLCDFNMAAYPFDTQNCTATFVMKGNLGKYVRLVPDYLDFLGPRELTQYYVQSSRVYSSDVLAGVQGVKVELIFARRLLSTFLTTYLPTILICLVSFTTNFYKGFFFEAIVTVNLTSMLLLVTLFISVSQSLPKTAYIKAIDIWLIFVLCIPFSEVFIHTLIDTMRVDEEREINHHGRNVTVPNTHPEILGKKGIFPAERNMINVTDPNNSTEKTAENISSARIQHISLLQLKERRDRLERLRITLTIARFAVPAIFLGFCIAYALYGITVYNSMGSSLTN